MIEIIFKNRDFCIVNKPIGMPSQRDPSTDADALSLLSDALLEKGESPQLWLVHRLDRVVGGLLVFARNKKTAAELSRLVSEGKIEKHYLAVAEGQAEGGEMRDLIYKDSLTSKAYVTEVSGKGAKEAILNYSAVAVIENDGRLLTLADVNLISGRYHQIRAQFSHRKMPLVGDKKYGSRDIKRKTPSLFAKSLSFSLFGTEYSFVAHPNTDEYPWSLFKKEINGD